MVPASLDVRRSRTILTALTSPSARIFSAHWHLHPQLNPCRNSIIVLSCFWANFCSQQSTERAPPWLPPPLQGLVELCMLLNCVSLLIARTLRYLYPRVSKDQPGGCKISDLMCANHFAGFAPCRVQIDIYISCKIFCRIYAYPPGKSSFLAHGHTHFSHNAIRSLTLTAIHCLEDKR